VVIDPYSQEGALQLGRRCLEATGYSWPELESENLEHGWKVFAGEDIGAVRIVISKTSAYFVEFDALQMWWPAAQSPWHQFRDWVAGMPALRPGGHLLWTQVLKARTAPELDSMLAFAQQMREAMLSKAERRGLHPATCRLYQFYGNRLSGAGETPDGLLWRAEVRHGVVRTLWDSAPLLTRAVRPFHRSR
jgi:hypothetical protein